MGDGERVRTTEQECIALRAQVDQWAVMAGAYKAAADELTQELTKVRKDFEEYKDNMADAISDALERSRE
jgi:predicted RNA-binding protein with PIN domain